MKVNQEDVNIPKQQTLNPSHIVHSTGLLPKTDGLRGSALRVAEGGPELQKVGE